MNTSQFMDKQIVGLLASASGKDFIDLGRSPEERHRNSGGGEVKKEDIIPSYDFHRIRPIGSPPSSAHGSLDASRPSRGSVDSKTPTSNLKIIGQNSIPQFHQYEISQPRWFSERSQGEPEKHQLDKVHPHLDDSTKYNDTSKVPAQLHREGGKRSQIISFSPLEARISGLRGESLKIKRIELSQKLTFALIPALLIISKTKLTTSLLILSVYWQAHGFFKEIFLDYVHQEVTRNWVLVYFKLLLLILAKNTFLYFNLV